MDGGGYEAVFFPLEGGGAKRIFTSGRVIDVDGRYLIILIFLFCLFEGFETSWTNSGSDRAFRFGPGSIEPRQSPPSFYSSSHFADCLDTRPEIAFRVIGDV